MKQTRFESVTIVYGNEDTLNKLPAVCACIAECEQYQSGERASA